MGDKRGNYKTKHNPHSEPSFVNEDSRTKNREAKEALEQREDVRKSTYGKSHNEIIDEYLARPDADPAVKKKLEMFRRTNSPVPTFVLVDYGILQRNFEKEKVEKEEEARKDKTAFAEVNEQTEQLGNTEQTPTKRRLDVLMTGSGRGHTQDRSQPQVLSDGTKRKYEDEKKAVAKFRAGRRNLSKEDRKILYGILARNELGENRQDTKARRNEESRLGMAVKREREEQKRLEQEREVNNPQVPIPDGYVYFVKDNTLVPKITAEDYFTKWEYTPEQIAKILKSSEKAVRESRKGLTAEEVEEIRNMTTEDVEAWFRQRINKRGIVEFSKEAIEKLLEELEDGDSLGLEN